MSFAQKYLDLVTECSQELRKQRKYQFFGVDAPWSDSKAEAIIQGSVEEWADLKRYVYNKNGIKLSFEFSTYEDCLFNEYCLNDSLDPDQFILDYFQYELEELKDNRELLTDVFKTAKEDGGILYFATMYTTAVEAKLVKTYEEKYKQLKAEYPGLPYYPSIGFKYSLTDYYESSTC